MDAQTLKNQIKPTWFIGGIIILILLWVISGYNGFVSRNQTVETQFAQIETAYQKRFDLMPNLISATSAVMKQEQKVFSDIANARANYAGARNTNEKIGAANQFDSAISRLLVVMEQYPQLQTAAAVKDFVISNTEIENQIMVERRRYNEMAGDFNVLVKRFPGNITALIFGFEKKELFSSEDGAEKGVKANFFEENQNDDQSKKPESEPVNN